uniref:Uncharacterized protein n=1 Tax=Lepeophtheirus salmonis TaxID=72036 RepID=A0A0K2VBE5_LEPSM
MLYFWRRCSVSKEFGDFCIPSGYVVR